MADNTNTTEKEKIDFSAIEKKWQRKWEGAKVFEAKEDAKKKKCYVLEMYPYPSASFLHMGHVRCYTIGDIHARFKRMNGFNVLYPMGYDSFGLPAETAAKKQGIHPKEYAENSIKKIMEYQKALGNSYDWSKVLASHDVNYYKWNQFFFLKLFEKGLAYRKKASVNWCEKCQSVLANEEAEGGKCWRCNSEVTSKDMEQWFFKITAYADRLLKDLDKIQWPERIKTMQRNWIDRKEWIDIDYKLDGADEIITVSTTRPDTNFGATFVVLAPEHSLLSKEKGLVPKKYRKAVDEYISSAKSKSDEERIAEGMKKTGVFSGFYCINNLTNKKMPVWVTDFVLISVGTGAVVGVPGHDIRDFEFAKEFNLPIVRVVVGKDGDKSEITKKEQVQEEEGTMINSGFLNSLDIHKATKEIMDYLEKKKWGRRTIRYKIRDWMISRQRYWGTPVPMIHCSKCGAVPVPEKELPVILPEKVDFKSANPLASNKEFVETKCPKCKGKAKRDTDTMGGFVDSSWYFLRYCDNKNKDKPFDKKKVNYWMPVDQYIGGAEHAVMHLIYARFFVKALKDMGFVSFDEPFTRLFNQGIVYKDGAKMSKSSGNVVFQTEISDKFGIDTARLFMMFVSSPDKQMEWTDNGVGGAFRIINKLINMNEKIKKEANAKEENKINITIKKVTESIESFEYPKAVVALIDAVTYFSEGLSKKSYEILLKLFSPFCPHISEELWEKIGEKGFVSLAEWPKADESKIDMKIEEEEKAVEKTVSDIQNILGIVKEKSGKESKKIYLYVLPNELENYDANALSKRINREVIVFAVNDKKKYDPESKAGKAKPGKPGIFVE
jgi:leucyl-tRNA synthetase